jgi:hypothetical protein
MHILTGSIKEQIEHFQKGFYDIIPRDVISVFNEQVTQGIAIATRSFALTANFALDLFPGVGDGHLRTA